MSASEIIYNYKYLIEIKCFITNNWNPRYIPSFTTNKKTGYLIKNFDEVKEFIKEIFMVWRYKYHSNECQKKREENIEYMKQTIEKIQNMSINPYLDFTVNSGIDKSINTTFTIYNMGDEFINLFEYNPKSEINNYYKHKVLPYVIFKDKNPNRLEVCIIQNPKQIKNDSSQVMLLLRNTYNYDFYEINFSRLGLKIRDQEKFMDLLNSKRPFVLTKEDFNSEKEIFLSNIHFLIGE